MHLPRCALVPALLAAVLALPGCATVPGPPTTAPAAVAADDNLNAVVWMQTSAEYAAVAEQTWRAAAERLEAALADSAWDALAPADRAGAPLAGLPPAVIVDVDETVLDNSPYQARLVRDGREFDDDSWDGWVAEAQAQPVPGALGFARAAAARGVTMIYLSNRTEAQQQATLANLRALGFPVGEGDVFHGKGTVVAGCTQAGSSDKTCRRRLVARQYRVLMQFGDQLGDFVAGPDNRPATRRALLDAHRGWFGARWWMLPNPSYGAWQPALFGDDWRLPRPDRRRALRDSLDTKD
jgi:5'-nucleotidase (lipoprotein e(P4) family)